MSPSLRRWIAAAAFALAVPAHAIPSYAEVKAAHRPSDVTVTDRHGVPIQTVRVDLQARRLAWVPIEDLSPALLEALVLSEDRRFHEHGGVDWAAIARSAWGTVWNERSGGGKRGGSTLTMQLAGLLEDDLARPAGGRSAGQKLGQVVAAQRIEARWSKQQILEAYLNLVGWRGEIVGIGALSQTLFGKLPSGLDAHEAAVAVALLRAPNAPPDTVAERACGVLSAQRLDCAGVTALAHGALARRGGMPIGEQLAPHAARQMLRGMRRDATAAPASTPTALRSTLDARVQRVATDALRRQMAELSGRNVEDGAVLVLDNASGEVLAWVGSSGRYSDAPAVDGVLARRQPGSTLKPFVYGLAFEQRLLTPATRLDDAPTQIATAAGLYLPQNYDRHFKGWVSARAALGASLNVPAVRVAAMLGPQAVFERLNAFGLDLPESGSYYGHALALGGADVSLLALTNAYRALASGGRWTPVAGPLGGGALAAPGRVADVSATPRQVADASATPRQVADASATWLVGHILADNDARALTFGLDSALATRGFAAVKTGTSKDLRDNWCVGYTERYTVGVWIGNASGEPMHQVSGVSGAAPVWQAVVRWLHRDVASRAPASPPGVVRARFDGSRAAGAIEASRDEFFLAGTEPAQGLSAGMAAARHGIEHPRDGSVFALDPDIPPAQQRIRFEGEAGQWVLDGRRLGRGATQSWAPWPGRHVLSLVGVDGKVRQTVRFEVRGAKLKPVAARR